MLTLGEKNGVPPELMASLLEGMTAAGIPMVGDLSLDWELGIPHWMLERCRECASCMMSK